MRPNYAPAGEHDFSLEPDVPGDSHLAITSPALSFPPGSPSFDAIKLYATTDDGKFVFLGRKNKGGFLGQVETEIEANDFRDAEEKAYRALVPSLSNWSAPLDISLTIWRVLVLSLETSARQDLLHVARVNYWLPLMKCIARRGTIRPPTSSAAPSTK